VEQLREAGAAYIHLRFAGPRYMFTCNLGMDTADQAEVIAGRGRTDEEIAAMLGVNSVAFNSVEAVEGAINDARIDPKANLLGKFCTACTRGDYPYGEPENALSE